VRQAATFSAKEAAKTLVKVLVKVLVWMDAIVVVKICPQNNNIL